MPVFLLSVPKQLLKSVTKGIKLRQGQGQNNTGMLTIHSRKTKAETFQFYYRTSSGINSANLYPGNPHTLTHGNQVSKARESLTQTISLASHFWPNHYSVCHLVVNLIKMGGRKSSFCLCQTSKNPHPTWDPWHGQVAPFLYRWRFCNIVLQNSARKMHKEST